jgi:hypothetical protein
MNKIVRLLYPGERTYTRTIRRLCIDSRQLRSMYLSKASELLTQISKRITILCETNTMIVSFVFFSDSCS